MQTIAINDVYTPFREPLKHSDNKSQKLYKHSFTHTSNEMQLFLPVINKNVYEKSS